MGPSPLSAIPQQEMTPRVQSAVMRLMARVDELTGELAATRKRLRELEALADEDPLVPLLNRRGFLREMERSIAYCQRYGGTASLIFLDLNGFKAINDRFGHLAGDAALAHVAEFLLAHVRKSDVVGRLGGDEFAILLQQATPQAAERKAERLCQRLADTPFHHEGTPIALSASWGVAGLTSSDDAVSLLCRADKAMYARKLRRAGKAMMPQPLSPTSPVTTS